MALARAYLEVVELSDLLELMAIRRYKLIWSVTTIGQEAVDLSYDDVSKVIDAIKTVIERLLLPTAEEPDGDAG